MSELAINGNGIRDTARVLPISPTTVIQDLKKTSTSRIHHPECFSLSSSTAISGQNGADEAEMGEMWSFVPSPQQRQG